VRLTTGFRRLLGVTQLFVRSVSFERDGLVVSVRPRWRRPRCGLCGQRAPGYDEARPRRWRHLGLGRTRTWLRYTPRRVRCATCGIRTEQVPWAGAGSRFTQDFEEMVAYLAQVTDKTQVTKMMGISWSRPPRCAGAPPRAPLRAAPPPRRHPDVLSGPASDEATTTLTQGAG